VDPVLKKILFERALFSPGDWYMQAVDLKAAADRLDYTKFPVRQDEDAISHIGTYQLLLSFSFENLLKGLIIFFRLRGGESQSLLREHFTHDLCSLANDPSCASLEVTSDELVTLDRLSAYGIWAGRYPRPKREADFAVVGHGNREYAAEQALWDRLSKFLYDRGWVKKWVDETKYGPILMLSHPDANSPDKEE
jgi:hypothetical protein